MQTMPPHLERVNLSHKYTDMPLKFRVAKLEIPSLL